MRKVTGNGNGQGTMDKTVTAMPKKRKVTAYFINNFVVLGKS